ncbi:MAG: glycosyltransferase family 4 protein [Acetobacteraceae bacterium]|nr:glycosyltransferase family 4 protein [Acetobacteraceae bacterium]
MRFAFVLAPPAETGGAGGTDYVNGLVPALRELGHEALIVQGGDGALPPGYVPVIDGMLLPSLRPRIGELVAADAVALVHHVSAAAGREDGAREAVLAIEREMLPRLRCIVATSQPVAERIQAEFDVQAHAVLPGSRDLPRNRVDADEPLVLSVGVLTRRKGHDLLLRAMARLTDLPWRLVIAGDAGREPAHAAELAALVEELGLTRRATLIPDPTGQDLQRAWEQATIFALATRWEGYAAPVAEALRRGVPVVVTDGGAAGALVPPDAGAVCPRDDMATFGKCLRRLLFDRTLRAEMAEAAWQAGQKLPGWPEQAQAFLSIMES